MPPRSATGHDSFYLWVALKWLHEAEPNQNSIILSEPYLNILPGEARWELEREIAAAHGYVPRQILRSEHTHIYPKKFTDPCDGVPAEVLFKRNITNVDEALVEWYISIIELEQTKRHGGLTLIAWLNNASLREAACRAGVGLIFNELGPLREPYYQPTIYFDCSGVNGQTEVSARWEVEHNSFKRWVLETFGEVPTAGRVRELIATPDSKRSFDETLHEGGIGIALQVETDSNAIAYGKGWSNRAIIEYANNSDLTAPLIHRHHPGGHMIYPGKIDHSISPIHFIKRVSEIWTVNSSLGIEAALWERNLRLLGESPFNLWENLPNDERDLFLAWFCFCYLVPSKLLFDRKYYTWRMTGPSVADLAMYHFNIYNESLTRAIPTSMSFLTESENKPVLETISIDAPMQHLARVKHLESQNNALHARIDNLRSEHTDLLGSAARLEADRARLETDYQMLKSDFNHVTSMQNKYKFFAIVCAMLLLYILVKVSLF